MYDDPKTSPNTAEPFYGGSHGGDHGEGLYDEPAFNAGIAVQKHNPIYSSHDNLAVGYLETGEGGPTRGGDGYLDVSPADLAAKEAAQSAAAGGEEDAGATTNYQSPYEMASDRTAPQPVYQSPEYQGQAPEYQGQAAEYQAPDYQAAEGGLEYAGVDYEDMPAE